MSDCTPLPSCDSRRSWARCQTSGSGSAAQIGYTGADLLIQGLRNAGKNLTADSFVAGIEKINGYHDIFGSPTVTFAPTKHQGASESFLLQIKGGRFVPVEAEPVGY